MTKQERDKMVEENMWVVDHVIKDYKHLMQPSELKSAGLYGLIRGIDKYKEGKGAKPSTYARHWVKAEVLSSLYENRNVHIPWNKINDYIKDVKNEEIYDSLSGNLRARSRRQRATKKHRDMLPQFEISLDHQGRSGDPDAQEGKSDNIELQSSLSSVDLHIKERQELRDHISFALDNSTLTEIELLAVKYRFGLEGDEPKTLSEISDLTGYTAMGIQKAEKRALNKLKKDELFKELVT